MSGLFEIVARFPAVPPARVLNRALAQAWSASGDRPGLARMVNAAPWSWLAAPSAR
jgi:hypothetical protein